MKSVQSVLGHFEASVSVFNLCCLQYNTDIMQQMVK